YQLSPSQLELEITETCIMPKFGAVSQVQQLAAKGLTLALDDFGTGYSSLSTLYRLSLHKLKIDRAFVKELEVSFDARTIVRTALSMGRGLGLETLAEGVETVGQLEVLELLGCDTYQGFLFHRPMEAEAFADLLRQRRGTPEDGADAGVPDVR
ncbi:MAG: EAL domain-containing protein, partial [Cyanobacteriota bacterium]|nr:EAL domain-containing protein [Cyanobacteriota bacterium]